MLPADEKHKEKVVLCDLLEMHLKEILLDDTAYEQIKDSIPQKGLRYQEGGNGNGVALVMMENYEGKQKGFSNGKVAIPIKLTESGMTLLENQANIAYILFHTRKKVENKHLFKVQGIVRILSNEEAVAEQTTETGTSQSDSSEDNKDSKESNDSKEDKSSNDKKDSATQDDEEKDTIDILKI